jgi:hypothetical protein
MPFFHSRDRGVPIGLVLALDAMRGVTAGDTDADVGDGNTNRLDGDCACRSTPATHEQEEIKGQGTHSITAHAHVVCTYSCSPAPLQRHASSPPTSGPWTSSQVYHHSNAPAQRESMQVGVVTTASMPTNDCTTPYCTVQVHSTAQHSTAHRRRYLDCVRLLLQQVHQLLVVQLQVRHEHAVRLQFGTITAQGNRQRSRRAAHTAAPAVVAADCDGKRDNSAIDVEKRSAMQFPTASLCSRTSALRFISSKMVWMQRGMMPARLACSTSHPQHPVTQCPASPEGLS